MLSVARRHAPFSAAAAWGACATLTLPPIGLFPLWAVIFPALVARMRTAPGWMGAAGIGWAFGAGYFIVGLYWISVALTVDWAQFGWALPLSLLVGPGIFGLYYALIPLIAWRWRTEKAAFLLAAAGAFAAVEWLRGHALTGFPWNLPGSSWVHAPPMLQSAAVIGVYGLTLATLLLAAAPGLWRAGARTTAAVLLAGGFGMALWGGARLMMHPAVSLPVQVRIVQPNIAQSDKWDADAAAQHFRRLLELTRGAAGGTRPDIVIWPETAVVLTGAAPDPVRDAIGATLKDGAVALVGALTVEGKTKFYNSVVAVDPAGQPRGAYHKHHLVPFGEYMPGRKWLNLTPVAANINMIGDFGRGAGPATLVLPGALPAAGPLVCYEVIFPGAVTDRHDRPGWLVNVTNDGWYGKTTGPYQHFESARMRAIEEGLPLVRAANTGISGVIDPFGRVTARMGLSESGAATAALPAPLPPTPYARWGDGPFALLLVLTFAGAELLLRRRRISE